MEYKTQDQLELDNILQDWEKFLNNHRQQPSEEELKKFPNGIVINDLVKHAGGYGAIGIFEFQNRPKISYVYKICTEPSFNLRHEMANLDILRGSRAWCPHFCESYGIVRAKVDPVGGSLFKESETAIEADIALMEFIPGEAFSKSIKELNHDQILSVLQQTLLAIDIMQTKFQMSHYDLHTSNVMLVCCHPETVFVYKWRGRTFVIPTRGVVPVIIDFGFAYSNLLEGPFYALMSFTNDGCLGCQVDNVYDPRVFLMDTVDELERLDRYPNLCSFLREFYPLKTFDPRTGEEIHEFDPNSGRSNDKFNPATKRIEDQILDIEKEKKISSFLVGFSETEDKEEEHEDSPRRNSPSIRRSDSRSRSHRRSRSESRSRSRRRSRSESRSRRSRSESRSDSQSQTSDESDTVYYNCTYLVEMVQSLQEYPLKLTGTLKTHYKDFRAAYIAFARQFVKYEDTVSSDFLRFLILRNMIDAARLARKEEGKTRLEVYRKEFFHLMNESCKFYSPPNDVDVDILLTSLYDMSKIILNGISHDLKMINRKRINRYRISTLELYDRLEEKVDRSFSLRQPLRIWDIDGKKTSQFSLTTEQQKEIEKSKKKQAGLIRLLEKKLSD